MPRRPRIHVPGLSHHVFQRGINRSDIFIEEADYGCLLWIIIEVALLYHIEIHAYALMTNHYHVILSANGLDDLADAMARINRRYTDYYNQKYGRIGPCWNGRYGATLIGTEAYWLTCLRYVELNPVRAGIVNSPEDYRWSSYRFHAHGEACDWLTIHRCYLALGPDEQSRQRAYRAMCAIPLTDAQLRLQRRPRRCQVPVPGT
jgi:putative transposase